MTVETADGCSAKAGSPEVSRRSPRELWSMDKGWRFHLGDIPFPEITGHTTTYQATKAGRAGGAAAPEFDDTEWRELDLPHDWVVEGPFDPGANLAQGYRRRGIAWYRRHFRLDPADRGRHLEIQFEGIATHATVWANGVLVHRNFCGYTSFAVDLTPLARFGEDLNCIAVRVDAEQQEGWWYEGGGIYRPTWLLKRSLVHIPTDGVFAQPRLIDGAGWRIPVEVTVFNAGEESAVAVVESVLLGPAGDEIARRGDSVELSGLERSRVHYCLELIAPKLWSVDVPTLYSVVTRLSVHGRVCDEVVTPVGFRTLHFDATRGFFLNGQTLKIKGTCNHQDHAGVGVAVPASLWEFRLRCLKEMGANAYRCAHHPPAKELLDAADRLGVLVMDENRNFNPSPEYLRQLEWLVRRDRNHPSVFLWSVFNEEPMQGTEQGYEIVRRLVAVVKALDPTRPVTAAMNGGLFAPINVAQAVDVVGFNYQRDTYDRYHTENPTRPLLSSEDTAALMQRGETETNPGANRIADDDALAPAWGATHRQAWKAIAERPFIAGGFVWTGFDYRGEPTPFEWPSTGASFGSLDLCGFPKSGYWLRQALWIETRPVLHLAPHWNWAGREGHPVRVDVVTNAETVELVLNHHSLGERRITRYEMATWDVPYVPGCLLAIARSSGREVARAMVETTDEVAALRLVADRVELTGDGRDTVPIAVEAIDRAGRVVPTANMAVEFSLEGAAQIIGVGNGNPNSHESEKASRRSLYHGLAQVLVQSHVGQGQVRLRAFAHGIEAAEFVLTVQAAHGFFALPSAAPVLLLTRWRHSPVFAARPDPNLTMAANDQNSWGYVTAGVLQNLTSRGWLIYRATFRPYEVERRGGGRVHLPKVLGEAEVWLDGMLVAMKAGRETGELSVNFDPGNQERTVTIMVSGDAGSEVGIAAPGIIGPIETTP